MNACVSVRPHLMKLKSIMNATPNNVVNIITGHLSAADTRALKLLLDASGLEYVLLPDLSQNLDGGHAHLPDGKRPGISPHGAYITLALPTSMVTCRCAKGSRMGTRL